MLRAALLAACVVFSACTVVKIGKGDTNTIQHEGGAEEAQNLATRACRRAGGQSAEIISTVNKDPSLPPGTGKQVTTFRCSSTAGRQQPAAPPPSSGSAALQLLHDFQRLVDVVDRVHATDRGRDLTVGSHDESRALGEAMIDVLAAGVFHA